MVVQHRSVSQYNQYYQCPWSYYLERQHKDEEGNRVWKRPAAWLVQGTAFHNTGDKWERTDRTMTIAEAVDDFRVEYSKAAAELLEETPRFDYWFSSGPYGGEADLERRMVIGGTQVANFIDYYTSHPDEKVWTDDHNERIIEKKYRIDLDGVTVEGYIDTAREVEGLGVIPEDYKTGNKVPDDTSIQLPTYKIFIEEENDVTITHGRYYMAKNGKPTKPYDLTDWSRERLTDEFHQLDEKIRAEDFPALPEEKKCMFCSVRAACEFAA